MLTLCLAYKNKLPFWITVDNSRVWYLAGAEFLLVDAQIISIIVYGIIKSFM
jgi:hypothetical protein